MRSNLELVDFSAIRGWAWDPLHPNSRVRINIFDNGRLIGNLLANNPRNDLKDDGIGDGQHGFVFLMEGRLDPSVRHIIEVKCADLDVALRGSPRILRPSVYGDVPNDEESTEDFIATHELQIDQGKTDALSIGNLEVVTRYLIRGWVWDESRPSTSVTVKLLDLGVEINRLVANRHRQDLEDAGIGDGRHGFEYHIPFGLSPNEQHLICAIRDFDGLELESSPRAIADDAAFDSDLKRMIADAVAGLYTVEDNSDVVSFLGQQLDRVLQQRADLDGQRQERISYQRLLRQGIGISNSTSEPSSATDWRGLDTRMRALVIDDRLPDTTRDAGSQAILSHMNALQRLDYAVSFVASEEFSLESSISSALEAAGISNFGPPYYGSVEEVMRRQSTCFDLIYLHRISNASKYLALARRYFPRSLVFYSVADLHHLRIAGQAEIEERPELVASSKRMRLLECTASWLADAVITHSPSEARWLRDAVPNAKVFVVPWSVPVSAVATSFSERQGLMFVGGFDHAPNIDAAHHLVQDIMPRVWKHEPNIDCLLVGSNMPPSIANLASDHVQIIGKVDDLTALFSRIRVSVAPLRYGAGIKGKVLTSFASGVPCVMTPVGAEGIDFPPILKGLVCNNEDEIAVKILNIYSEESLFDEFSKAGQSLIYSKYSHSELDKALLTAINCVS